LHRAGFGNNFRYAAGYTKLSSFFQIEASIEKRVGVIKYSQTKLSS
jgi:hypothetical protein